MRITVAEQEFEGVRQHGQQGLEALDCPLW